MLYWNYRWICGYCSLQRTNKANRRKMRTNTICVHMPAQSLQRCLALCDPVDCSLPIQCPQVKEGAI